MFSLICVRINGWVNNREAGDLRRYRAHYDVSVMNSSRRSGIYMPHQTGSSLFQIMVPSHYLNHCWILINLTLGSTFQWNLLQNTTYFTQENASEDVVCKIAAILAWSQSVKMWEQSYTAISTAKIETANLQRLGPKLWFATAYQCYPCRGTTLKSRGRRWLAGSQRQHWPANRNMLSLLLISQLATGRWYRIEEKVGNVGVVSQ